MKKLILICIFSSLLFACGKKGDPSFEEPKAKALTPIELTKKV